MSILSFIFDRSERAKLSRIKKAVNTYQTAYFANPFHAGTLDTALRDLVCVVYEEATGEPHPGFNRREE